MPSIFLKKFDRRINKKLCGNIAICYFFVSTPDAPWNQICQSEFETKIKKVSDFFEKEANKKGIPLTIKNEIRSVTFSHTIYSSDDAKSWEREILKVLRYSDILNMWHIFKSKLNVEDVAFCLVFYTDGRGFATLPGSLRKGGFAVVYNESTVGTCAHEICHLYGAKDFYYTEFVEEMVKKHFGKSIMVESDSMVIDPLTAYLIGWDKKLDSRAKAFLKDTAGITTKEWEKAEEQT